MLPFAIHAVTVLVLIVGLAETVDRPLGSVTDDAALSFLTTDMSAMENFKSDILEDFAVVRVSGTKENEAVQKHIKSILSRYGWDIEEDTFKDSTPHGKKKFNNIIATYGTKKSKRVVLACHFDSKFYRTPFIGAMDSAVPCSILLESIKQLDCLLQHGPGPDSPVDDVTLQLIFFDGEEAFKRWTATDSLYGARHLARRWETETEDDGKTKLEKIRELILLDLIGPTDTRFHMEFTSTSTLYKNLVDTEKLLREKKLLTGRHKATIFNDRRGSGMVQDDHIPFLERGVDIMHLIATPFPKVWHSPEDDLDHMDYDLIDDFSRIFRVFLSNVMHLRPMDSTCRRKDKNEL